MENEQAALWNGDAAESWIKLKDVLDEMFRPFEHLLAERIPLHSAKDVLDIGCGTGSTSLAVARRLGGEGSCLGVDISAPMISIANDSANLPKLRFLCCDVQRQAFAPASFDTVISRFGVMFFDDPVAAFANIHRAARDGAELQCFAWRAASENPFMTAAEQAVASLLPARPSDPDGPGQFAFARRERVHEILAASGWKNISIEPVDVECTFAAADLPLYVSRMGSVGRALAGLPKERHTEIIERALSAFDQFEHDGVIRYTAACWDVRASA